MHLFVCAFALLRKSAMLRATLGSTGRSAVAAAKAARTRHTHCAIVPNPRPVIWLRNARMRERSDRPLRQRGCFELHQQH